MPLTKAQIKRLGDYISKGSCVGKCAVCGGPLNGESPDDLEYVKTKRGTELFLHTQCVKRWGK